MLILGALLRYPGAAHLAGLLDPFVQFQLARRCPYCQTMVPCAGASP